MDDLIEALTIFRKYGNPHSPTHCEHDELTICSVEADKVSDEDTKRLNELGFQCFGGDDHFMSFRFGSC